MMGGRRAGEQARASARELLRRRAKAKVRSEIDGSERRKPVAGESESKMEHGQVAACIRATA